MYALGRVPNERERAIMFAALQRYRDKYGKDPAAAEKLLQVGDSPIDRSSPPAELASWMMICSTLINTDEFLTQH
jgi:hypothetical protein